MNSATPSEISGKDTPTLPRLQRAVYNLLSQGGQFSAADISIRLHLSDPRGHIRCLRDKGIRVLDEWRTSEHGTRYKLYYLPYH